MYDWFRNTKSNYEKNFFYKIYIDFPRDKLIKRINLRVHKMIKRGAVLEVKKFIKLKIPSGKSAHKAIGINEIRDHLNNESKISEVIEKISIKTRQYAKRQNTWRRGNMMDWKKISHNSKNNFLKKI